MKDQILALEPNDDLALLRDRIMRAQADRILLQLTPGSFLRRLDIALARRWAQHIGAQLILVSGDRFTSIEASKAGVTSFATIDAAVASSAQQDDVARLEPLGYPPIPAMRPIDADREPDGKRSLHPVATRNKPVNGALSSGRQDSSPAPIVSLSNFLFAASIVSIVGVALLLMPHAQVILAMPVNEQRIAVPIDPALMSTVSGEVAVSRSVATTGRFLVSSSYAVGELLLFNTGEELLAIPPGTQFRDPVSAEEFETFEGGWLDPSTSSVFTIRAVIPGPSGNLPAGRIRGATGLPVDRIQVQQPGPTSGGESEWRASVSARDLRTLRERAEVELSTQAQKSLAADAGNQGLTLVEDSLTILERTETNSAPVGAAVDLVGLTLSARVEARAVDIEKMLVIARRAAESRAGGDSVILPNRGDIRVLRDSRGDPWIEFTLRRFGGSLPSNITQLLVFRTHSKARQIIEAHLAEGRVEVDSWPAWWPFLPAFPSRIEIVTRPDAEQPSVVR